MHKKMILIITLLTLTACTQEKNYRGIPEPVWQRLTVEQKKLIDHSYTTEKHLA